MGHLEFNVLNFEEFHSLCNMLIMSEYPNAIPLNGSGGDSGKDIFIGNFSSQLKVFQHKHFTKRLDNSYKKMIEDSLDTAVKSHPTLKEWTLCIPIDLTQKELKWFEVLRKRYPAIRLNLWSRTKLELLLSKYPNICSKFFPWRARPKKAVVRLGESEEDIIEDIKGTSRFDTIVDIDKSKRTKVRRVEGE